MNGLTEKVFFSIVFMHVMSSGKRKQLTFQEIIGNVEVKEGGWTRNYNKF